MMRARLLTLAVCAAATPAVAETTVGVLGGEHDNYRRLGAHVRFDPLWTGGWRGWQAALHPEVELSRFRYDGKGRGPGHLNEVGAVALLRAVYGDGAVRPYAEAGLGAALFSRTDLGSKVFSTTFQFSQHLGLGVEITPRASVGWRYSHYSNGDIEMPNDGIDLHQIVVDLRF